ncbi:MAG: hypothetical protein PHY56_05030 [Candidatus Omnitrophica bacterium]|nr:hypothetical protein [Candidatus Omnitrophota bacterium]
MRTLLVFMMLFFLSVPLSFAREIFEGGYSGNYAKDGFKPDITIDVFSGEEKTVQRQQLTEVYSAFPMQNNDYNHDGIDDKTGDYSLEHTQPSSVYVGPISDIIKKQAEESADSKDNKDSKEAE